MYATEVTNHHIAAMEREFQRDLRAYTPAECEDFKDRLSDVFDKKGNPQRNYTQEESAFVENELLMTKCSFPYWAERYAKINVDASTIRPMYPLLPSQEFIITEIGRLELQAFQGERNDGILINLLKGGRQIGGSTLAEAISAHRATTQNNIQGLIASDVPESSGYLFGMMERIIEGLPGWLAPTVTEKVKNTEIVMEGGSHIWTGAGKSVRGTTGARGQLGRGKTLSVVHLSELSTWDATDQIDGSLLPTIPRNPRSFVMFESTAKGRNNWWHKHWKACSGGENRFSNVFIPWYAEPTKYSQFAPADWTPAETTLAHARRAEELGPRWIHRPVKLTREQLYWYEVTRRYYEQKELLHVFIEEYGSVDDDECFQHSGRSIFNTSTLQRMVDAAKPIGGCLEIRPMRDLR